MTYTFERFRTQYEEFDDMTIQDLIDGLSKDERNSLEREVWSWTEDLFEPSVHAFDRCGLVVPVDIIRVLLSNDIELAFENFTDGIGDTCQREILVDSLMHHIGMRSWPCNGEIQEVSHKFLENLRLQCEKFSITLNF